ncbi:MAG: hypothetical protein KKD39_05855 [Candidatus Altiarchaeota archaeon]|nr:hypothetical protein [Candidatus Altiarchaeota archaeon]
MKHEQHMPMYIIAIVAVVAIVMMFAVRGPMGGNGIASQLGPRETYVGKAIQPLDLDPNSIGGSPVIMKGGSPMIMKDVPLTPDPVCGDFVCQGGEIVSCDADCSFINVKNIPITMFDFKYDSTYPSWISFKVHNTGDAFDTDNLGVAFAGNGISCSSEGRGYRRSGVHSPETIPHHSGVDEFTEVVIRGTQPLLSSSRHCNNPFRFGLFTWGEECNQEEYLAIANTIIDCVPECEWFDSAHECSEAGYECMFGEHRHIVSFYESTDESCTGQQYQDSRTYVLECNIIPSAPSCMKYNEGTEPIYGDFKADHVTSRFQCCK